MSSYAGLVSRLSALTVDIAGLTLTGLAVSILPGLAAQQVTGEAPGWLTGAATWLASLLPWLYFTACWWLGGQTVGGMLIGITVTQADGGRLGLLRSGLRAFAGLAFFPLWTIGLVTILFDPRRRALHDMVFGTQVRFTHAPEPASPSVTGSKSIS